LGLVAKNDLTLYGTFAFNSNTFPSAIKLSEEKKIDLKSIISHILDLENFESGLELMKKGKSMKILFKF